MVSESLSIDQLRELINKGEVKDPLVFLECVMSGQDPRNHSDLFELVQEIHEFTGGDIDSASWLEVVEAVKSKYKYQKVTLAQSSSAAKFLSEYLYPKVKAGEFCSSFGGGEASQHPLSEKEIELFKRKFNEEF